jgi:hypothetical protein
MNTLLTAPYAKIDDHLGKPTRRPTTTLTDAEDVQSNQ